MYLVPEEINIAELLIILLSDAFADLVSTSSFEGYKRNCAVNNLAGLSLNHWNPPDPSFWPFLFTVFICFSQVLPTQDPV